MFNPSDDEQSADWFQRLRTSLKRLPADEQARVQEEVKQHLEALAADSETQGDAPEAAWRSALTQFGDPESFGLRMAEEWRQSKRGVRADLMAIGFGLCLHALFWPIDHSLRALWFQSLRDAHGISVFPFIAVLRTILSYGEFFLLNAAIGLRYPLQALKGAFYSSVLWGVGITSISFLMLFTLIAHSQHSLAMGPQASVVSEENRLAIVRSLLIVPLWPVMAAAVSYLASVTKRGWYAPTLEDFKLTLPKKRRQIASSL